MLVLQINKQRAFNRLLYVLLLLLAIGCYFNPEATLGSALGAFVFYCLFLGERVDNWIQRNTAR